MEHFDWTKANNGSRQYSHVKVVSDTWAYIDYYYDANAEETRKSYTALSSNGPTINFSHNVFMDMICLLAERTALDGRPIQDWNLVSGGSGVAKTMNQLLVPSYRWSSWFKHEPAFEYIEEILKSHTIARTKPSITGSNWADLFLAMLAQVWPFVKGDYWYIEEQPYGYKSCWLRYYRGDTWISGGTVSRPNFIERSGQVRGEYFLKLVEAINNYIDCTSLFASCKDPTVACPCLRVAIVKLKLRCMRKN